MNRGRTLLEIFLFVSVVLLDAFGFLPITQTLYLVPLIWLALRLQKQNFKTIGLSKGRWPLWKSIALGTIIGILLEVFATWVTTPLLSRIFGAEPDLSEFSDMRGNLNVLLFFIALSWVIAAFGEEICFRGFLMNRLATLFGNTRAAWLTGLILSSILFGWGHTEQGITGWIQEGLSGLYLGILFLASGKNLALPIVSHGISNTLAFVLIYLGKYPGA